MSATNKTIMKRKCDSVETNIGVVEESLVKIFVRVRPALPREIMVNGEFCSSLAARDDALYVTTTDEPVLVSRQGNKISGASGLHCFTFDGVFQQEDSTETVYRACCLPAVEQALSGYNATCLACKHLDLFCIVRRRKTFSLLCSNRRHDRFGQDPYNAWP